MTYPPQHPHQPQQPYPATPPHQVQQPYPPQPYYQAPPPGYPTQAVTKTRRAFNHSKHVKWTVLTFGVWGIIGYLPAWCWNRFGPEKSVSVTQFR